MREKKGRPQGFVYTYTPTRREKTRQHNAATVKWRL